jgi:hypothetical protein
VHFLRHGEDEWLESRFPTFLLYVYEGFPADAALEVAYGWTVDQAQELFADYVKGF